jgi:hypothetical protein
MNRNTVNKTENEMSGMNEPSSRLRALGDEDKLFMTSNTALV